MVWAQTDSVFFILVIYIMISLDVFLKYVLYSFVCHPKAAKDVCHELSKPFVY